MAIVNREQAEEVHRRFRELVPDLIKDKRFMTMVVMDPKGNYFPIIYLAIDDVKDDSIPLRYVYVLKKGEDAYHILMEKIFNIFGAGIPGKWWPRYVTSEELAKAIIDTWENWFRIDTALDEEIKRLQGPDKGTLPF